jgi:galactose mutarotase-like enzyme
MSSWEWSDGHRGAANVSEAWGFHGLPAVVLENPSLRFVVVPRLGGRVVSMVSKAADRDLLFHHPRSRPREAVFGAEIDDWWAGGIDEVAPTGHRCTVAGESLPPLGELWSQAWEARVVERGPEVVSVELRAAGVITPVVAERRMELRADRPFVVSTHRLTNVGYKPVPLMWGIHPGIAVRPGSRIDVPGRRGTFWEGDPAPVASGASFEWPRLPAADREVDLSECPPPEPPTWHLSFVDELSAGWLSVTDPQSRSGFAMTFDPDVFSCVWVWGVYGGWRGLYTVAVEPWTAWPPRLDQVIDAGRATVLEPGETLETNVRFIAHTGFRSVATIDADGLVHGAR